MNKIKFSKKYPKLWGQTKAYLIHIEKKERKDFHNDLLEYDTKAEDGTYYPLNAKTYLILYFIGDKDIPFCTIRRWTPQKEAYYMQLEREEFDIVLTS